MNPAGPRQGLLAQHVDETVVFTQDRSAGGGVLSASRPTRPPFQPAKSEEEPMAVTHPAPAPTAEELRQLKAYFEKTRTLPSLLSTLRSRRVARGYHIESGAQETHPATGHTLH